MGPGGTTPMTPTVLGIPAQTPTVPTVASTVLTPTVPKLSTFSNYAITEL